MNTNILKKERCKTSEQTIRPALLQLPLQQASRFPAWVASTCSGLSQSGIIIWKCPQLHCRSESMEKRMCRAREIIDIVRYLISAKVLFYQWQCMHLDQSVEWTSSFWLLLHLWSRSLKWHTCGSTRFYEQLSSCTDTMRPKKSTLRMWSFSLIWPGTLARRKTSLHWIESVDQSSCLLA